MCFGIAIGLGVVLWGLHMGLTQGLLATLVADTVPAELCGTGFGVVNLVSGLALLAASVFAGGLWDSVGPRGTFVAGAAFAALSLIGLLLLRSLATQTNGGSSGSAERIADWATRQKPASRGRAD